MSHCQLRHLCLQQAAVWKHVNRSDGIARKLFSPFLAVFRSDLVGATLCSLFPSVWILDTLARSCTLTRHCCWRQDIHKNVFDLSLATGCTILCLSWCNGIHEASVRYLRRKSTLTRQNFRGLASRWEQEHSSGSWANGSLSVLFLRSHAEMTWAQGFLKMRDPE